MPGAAGRGSTSTPRIDVVLTTHNREVLLPRALGSVLTQTAPGFTCFVVADGCTDGTANYLDSVSDERVRVLHTDGLGPCGARNHGASAGSAPLLAFLDDDNLWRPRFLAVMAEHMAAGAVLAYSGQQCYLASGPPENLRVVGRRIRSVPFNPVTLLDANYIDTSCVLLDRRAFEAAGGFDPALTCLQDWDLYGRIAATHPFDVIHVDEVLGEYWYYTTATMPTVQNSSWGDQGTLTSFGLGPVAAPVAEVRARLREATRNPGPPPARVQAAA